MTPTETLLAEIQARELKLRDALQRTHKVVEALEVAMKALDVYDDTEILNKGVKPNKAGQALAAIDKIFRKVEL